MTDSPAFEGKAKVADIALIAFTEQGCDLAVRLAEALRGEGEGAHAATVAGPERFAEPCGIEAYESLDAWTREAFATRDALVFVSVTGIAVRAIAPYVKDKFSDPAVVSVDERGQFAVPLLSGHVGGANDLARQVARIIGARPVISTATDVNGLFAVDQWAREQGMVVVERDVAKKVSATLLAGNQVFFASDFPVEGAMPEGVMPIGKGPLGICVTLNEWNNPFDETLHLVPRIVTVGAGCHRDQDSDDLRRGIAIALGRASISPRAVRTLASIDLKADEPAFHEIAEKNAWQLAFYSADELNAVPGEFESSEFVRSITGTDNVCERAALASGGTLLQGKQKLEGVTVALACDEFTVRFVKRT